MDATQVAALCHLPKDESRLVLVRFHQRALTQNLFGAASRSLFSSQQELGHFVAFADPRPTITFSVNGLTPNAKRPCISLCHENILSTSRDRFALVAEEDFVTLTLRQLFLGWG